MSTHVDDLLVLVKTAVPDYGSRGFRHEEAHKASGITPYFTVWDNVGTTPELVSADGSLARRTLLQIDVWQAEPPDDTLADRTISAFDGQATAAGRAVGRFKFRFVSGIRIPDANLVHDAITLAAVRLT